MNENLELSKVRILTNHLQSNINVTYSLIISGFVSFSIALLTISFHEMDLRPMFLLPIVFTGFWAITQFQIKKYQLRNLRYIDELLERIEKGEQLPSMDELEKELYKR